MSYVAVLAEKHSFLWRNCCLLQTIETFHRIFYTSDISDVAVLERNRNCVAFVDKQSRNFPQKILDQPIRRNIKTSSLKDSVMSWLIRVLVDCDISATKILCRTNLQVLKSKRTHTTKFLRGIRRAHRRIITERLQRQYTLRHFFDPSVPTPALTDPYLRVP